MSSSAARSSFREEAARQVFERYVHQLKALVRWQLNVRIRRKEGTSDIVQDVLKSFFASSPDLSDPDSLWLVLVGITRNKARNVAAKYTSQKRDVRRERSSGLEGDERSAVALWDLGHLPCDPSSEDAALFIETLERLTEVEQQLVKWKLDGHSYKEIANNYREFAGKKKCSNKTIQRLFQSIRRKLEAVPHGWRTT